MARSTNTALSGLKTSGIRRYTAMASEVEGCVKLTLGEPEFATPEAVCEEVPRSLARGLTHYPPNNGRPDLLEALSEHLACQGLGYASDELIVTVGATEALSSTLLALLDPGDEVIIPLPAFGLYESLVVMAHGTPVFLDTAPDRFQIDADRLASLVGERAKAIVLTSPNNPTGCIYSSASLDAVAEVAARTGIYVICDDVYNQLVYDDGYERLATRHPELRDQLVIVDSFSKPWAMTGWRLGWLAAAPAVKAEVQKAHQYLVSSVPAFVQDAARVALSCDPAPMREAYRARRDCIVARLSDMGLSVERPAGAFYAFPSIASTGLGSDELCERLIREARVALVPGTCFGSEGFVRLSYCVSDDDLTAGLDRLGRFLEAL